MTSKHLRVPSFRFRVFAVITSALIAGYALLCYHLHGLIRGDSVPLDRRTVNTHIRKADKPAKDGRLLHWYSNESTRRQTVSPQAIDREKLDVLPNESKSKG